MSTVAMSGSDTVKINGRIFNDLADGDFAKLTYPTDVANIKTGKNGNSIYALNETGKQSEFELRLIRGSDDDKFMNNLLSALLNNFAAFVLLNGEFTKKIGDGLGNVASDTYINSGGIITKVPEATGNAEGNTDQSVSIWHMKFTNKGNPRAIT